MREAALSRRTLLGAGACALAAAASIPQIARARAEAGLSAKSKALVRKYYAGWEKKDWLAFNTLLTDDFTFSSPVDAQISKSAFKKGCWDTQIALLGHFDLEHVVGAGNDAFVMYLCHTASDKTFRNVEYFRLKGEQVQAVECYFGGQGYPSAVDGRK
jgi:ketosteroid isomerase-like protein